MKRLLLYYVLILLAMVGWATAKAAPTLQWDASTGADGYNVYCSELPVTPPAPLDAGNVVTYDLAAIVTAGTTYECWVTAYAAGFLESGHSNHLVFTSPAPPEVVVVPGPPPIITITW